MDQPHRSVDEQIRKAILEGKFDNLSGKGKPLDLTPNPHEDPSWRTAFNMLRSSGHTLPWIQARKEIEDEFEEAKKSLAQTWAWRCEAVEESQPDQLVSEEWQRALKSFKERIANLNKRIFVYNLEVPADQFKRRTISIDRVLDKITAQPD